MREIFEKLWTFILFNCLIIKVTLQILDLG
jgi:hypothetical protein